MKKKERFRRVPGPFTGDGGTDGEHPAKKSRGSKNSDAKRVQDGEEILSAIPSVKIPGHTGYLVFATFFGRGNKPLQPEGGAQTEEEHIDEAKL